MSRTSNICCGAGLKLAWLSLVCGAWLYLGRGTLAAADPRGPGPATGAKPTKE